jgi:hypothetical protein
MDTPPEDEQRDPLHDELVWSAGLVGTVLLFLLVVSLLGRL